MAIGITVAPVTAMEAGPSPGGMVDMTDIMYAAAAATTIASLGSNLALRAVAGVTEALCQSASTQLPDTQDGSAPQEQTKLTPTPDDTTKGTMGVRTPNPYKGYPDSTFPFPKH